MLDTAGLDAPRDALEAEGIRRSRAAIEESDLLLVVLDGSRRAPQDVLSETACRPRIVVRSKSDLPRDPSIEVLPDVVDISAVTGHGLDRLARRLSREVEARTDAEGDGVSASLRQMEGLEALERSLTAAARTLAAAPVECALVDLRDALGHASALLGIDVGDAVLDRIFATFCLGK